MLTIANPCVIPISEQINDCWHRFLLDRPKLAAITGVALAALAQTVYYFSGSSPLCALALVSAVILEINLAYEWRHLLNEVWYGLLNRPYEPSFKQTFKEEKFLGDKQEVLATLEYNGKLPILTFDPLVTDPTQRGYIHGYMLADQIVDLGQKALRPILAFLQWEKGDKGDANLKLLIDRLEIPSDAREELVGITKGIQERFRVNGKKCPDDVTSFIFGAHVMTDHYKAIGSSLGCSTLVYRSQIGDPPIIGRNLDWVSMGYLGRHLFVRRYSVATENGNRVVSSFAFPGYIGALTAWNSDGLVVIINELGKTSKGEGKPYVLMTKELVEKCATVDEAVECLNLNQQNTPCASSVSIIIVDKKQSKIFHYYPEGSDHILLKDLADDGILAVTNHAHDALGNILLNSICEQKSVDRLNRLQKAIEKGKSESKQPIEIVESAIKAAGVSATVGVFIADLSSGEKKILLDDFFAHKQIDKQPYIKI
ncbi:MAG: hypothetical protein H0X29_12130 [Parachlamydiaceae bacterium]|nr:hypothetical protein [Parachlamydiaceae bacterium]